MYCYSKVKLGRVIEWIVGRRQVGDIDGKWNEMRRDTGR